MSSSRVSWNTEVRYFVEIIHTSYSSWQKGKFHQRLTWNWQTDWVFWGTLQQPDQLNNFGTELKGIKWDGVSMCAKCNLKKSDWKSIPNFFPVVWRLLRGNWIMAGQRLSYLILIYSSCLNLYVISAALSQISGHLCCWHRVSNTDENQISQSVKGSMDTWRIS